MHAQNILFDGLGPLEVIAFHQVPNADGTASGPLPAAEVTGRHHSVHAATEHRP